MPKVYKVISSLLSVTFLVVGSNGTQTFANEPQATKAGAGVLGGWVTETSKMEGFPLELTRVLHNPAQATKVGTRPERLFLKPFLASKNIELGLDLSYKQIGMSGSGGPISLSDSGKTSIFADCTARTAGAVDCDSVLIYKSPDISSSSVSSDYEKLDISSLGGIDNHEILPDPDGKHFWAARYLVKPCGSTTYLCGIKSPKLTKSFFDCEVIKFDRNAKISFSWLASRKLPKSELRMEHWASFPIGGAYDGIYADPFHCNSIDVSADSKKFLVSMRHTDSVYEVDVKTGSVNWKLGGNLLKGKSLLINGKNPSTVLGGQHDARYAASGAISVFDNGTNQGRAARGLVVLPNQKNKSAKIISEMKDPLGENSRCTGSFRSVAKASYWVATWGCSSNGATVFDSKGKPIVSAYFARSEANRPFIGTPISFIATGFGYRALPYTPKAG